MDNAIQKGVQEIVRAIIFRAFQDWKPFSLPICSYTSFQTTDAIINLDIKTVKSIDNDAKQGYLQIRRNQISYPNKNVKGIPWIQHQPVEIKIKEIKVPTFSYFVKFIWVRERDQINIKEIVICSVPNEKLAKIYGNDFIVNYKTYDTEEIKKEIDENNIIEKWESEGWKFIKLKTGEICGKNKKDNTKKYGDKWHFIKSGDTARFKIKDISKPKLTKEWERLEYIKFNSENQSKLS